MWKDWLTFSRREQYGLVFLSILIVILLAIRLLLPVFSEPAQFEIISDVDFISSDSEEHTKENKRNFPVTKKEVAYNFFDFNPNTVTVTELSKMGFSPFVIVNWIKFREAGGRFENVVDAKKIYGVDSLIFERMKPYICLLPEKEQNQDNRLLAGRKKNASQDVAKENDNVLPDFDHSRPVIDLNKADTALLRQVKGIGTVFSKRIVAFRNLLGGFHSRNQLSEVYGLPPELIEEVKPQFTVNPDDVEKLAVNALSLRSLKAHPYISFYQAKEIVEYRREKGVIFNQEVLEQMSSFDETSLEKVLPYISFEEKNTYKKTKN